MPRSLPGRQILRLCSAQRSLEIKVLANESSWAAVRQRLHCTSGRPKPKKGAKSSKVTVRKQAALSEAYQQLPQLVWDVENPILWDAKFATVCQVAVAMLVAIFSSLRHETQWVGYQAAVQAGSSSWQQQLLGLRPSEMKAKLNSEQQWKQLQQEAAVALFTNPPVRARLGAGGGAPAQQYEACMVVQQKQVCRWVPAAAAVCV